MIVIFETIVSSAILFGYDRDRNLYIKYMISDEQVNVNRCCARNGQNFGFLAHIRSRNPAFLHKSRIYLALQIPTVASRQCANRRTTASRLRSLINTAPRPSGKWL
jgi:hypothetical protein